MATNISFSAANMFMEDTVVGGIPCFTWGIRKWLPKNKKKREKIYRIQMVILTYVTYSLFNMVRRPMAVVKSKIIEECNSTYKAVYLSARASGQTNVTNQWCEETFLQSSTEEFMGFLDSVYIAVYGLSLYMSGVTADCYNPRFYLTMGCLLSGFFCAILGLSDFWEIRSFKFFTVVLVLLGASQSTGWPVVLSCVTHWYSGGKRGTFFGFWNTHNYVGSVLGIYIAGSWVDKHWGLSFVIPGFILAVMGILVYSCMVVDPEDLKELDEEKSVTSRRFTEMEVPQWLSSSRSIELSDALKLPGVIEFSTCMFFSRMVGYTFLFWLPTFIKQAKGDISISSAAYYSIAYVVGGSLGGVVAGVLVDVFRRTAVVCAFFLLVSIPILFLGLVSALGKNIELDFPLYLLIGLFVEAPYIVTSTSVSAELGTHKMIKRNHRALSTVGGIMEGTGAIGAAIGTYVCGVVLIKMKWEYIIYVMMALQFVATMCLSRQAYKDFFKKQERRTLTDYWTAPSIF